MEPAAKKAQMRKRRHRRVRKRLEGTPERPRLCVFRSNRHIYAQVIDDWNRRTLASCSSLSRELRDELAHGRSVESAARVGEVLARKCIESVQGF